SASLGRASSSAIRIACRLNRVAGSNSGVFPYASASLRLCVTSYDQIGSQVAMTAMHSIPIRPWPLRLVLGLGAAAFLLLLSWQLIRAAVGASVLTFVQRS